MYQKVLAAYDTPMPTANIKSALSDASHLLAAGGTNRLFTGIIQRTVIRPQIVQEHTFPHEMCMPFPRTSSPDSGCLTQTQIVVKADSLDAFQCCWCCFQCYMIMNNTVPSPQCIGLLEVSDCMRDGLTISVSTRSTYSVSFFSRVCSVTF